jgi:AcrR family transcriptional regulator
MSTRPHQGRRERSKQAILDATRELINANGGVRTLTVESVAARSGVAKTTIYRRWGSLDGLLADLMAERAAQEIPVPDEGDLGSDLRMLARHAVASVRDPAVRAALASIVAAAVQSPAAREVLTRFLAGRTATMTVIVDRAVRRVRGALNPSLDIEGVLLTMYDDRTNLGQLVARDVREFFKEKVFNTIIPRNVRLGEAPSHGVPCVLYDAKSRGAAAYVALAKEMLARHAA